MILIFRLSMLSNRLARPGKLMLIFPRVVTGPSLFNHSEGHPLHSGSVLTYVPCLTYSLVTHPSIIPAHGCLSGSVRTGWCNPTLPN